jgi:hypothetical protein
VSSDTDSAKSTDTQELTFHNKVAARVTPFRNVTKIDDRGNCFNV